VTQATRHHAAAMAAIHAAAFPDDPWSETSFSRLLGQPGVAGFIDERGGIVLLRCAADEAEILTIGVAKPRQGIATTLMQTALAYAQTQNAKTMHLEVAASNTAARALYDSLGFKQTGHRRNYYANGGDALILSLSLEESTSFCEQKAAKKL
jgi:ribosomal-protein-alanine N-acetyltransferase